jgi:hypothetical protein
LFWHVHSSRPSCGTVWALSTRPSSTV